MMHRVTVTYVFEIHGAPSEELARQLALTSCSSTAAAQHSGILKRLTSDVKTVTPEQLVAEHAEHAAGIISLDGKLRGKT